MGISSPDQKDKAIGKTDPQCEEELGHDSEEVIGDGHSPDKENGHEHIAGYGDHGCHAHAKELAVAGKAPDALVEVLEPEDEDNGYGIDEDGAEIYAQIFRRNGGIPAVEPKPKGQEIGQADSKKVIGNETKSHDLPVQ